MGLQMKCPICDKNYPFGDSHDCLQTKAKIERLHREMTEILNPKGYKLHKKKARIFVINDGKETLFAEVNNETDEDRNYIECTIKSLKDVLGYDVRLED